MSQVFGQRLELTLQDSCDLRGTQNSPWVLALSEPLSYAQTTSLRPRNIGTRQDYLRVQFVMDDQSLVQISQNLLTCDDSDNWNDFNQFVYLDQPQAKKPNQNSGSW